MIIIEIGRRILKVNIFGIHAIHNTDFVSSRCVYEWQKVMHELSENSKGVVI